MPFYKGKKKFTPNMKNIYNALYKEGVATEMERKSILIPYFPGGTTVMA